MTCRHAPSTFRIITAVGLRLRGRDVTRYASRIDRINLIGRHKFMSVLLVNPFPHKHVEKIRVDVSIQLELPQNGQSLAQRLSFFVRAVTCGECFEDVCYAHASRLD